MSKIEIGSIINASNWVWSGNDSVGEKIEVREDGINKEFKILSILPDYTKEIHTLIIKLEEVNDV